MFKKNVVLYFWLVNDPVTPYFLITPKKFFDKSNCLSDQEGFEKYIPDGFHALQESTFEYDGDPEDGKKALLAAGHIEKDMLPAPQADVVATTEETPKKEVKEAPKKEVKTFNVVLYTVVVSLDGQMEESFSVEGPSTKFSFEKFLKWYLVFRSKKFPNLVYSDVEDVVKSSHELLTETQEFVVGVHEAAIPIKNESKEVTGKVTLTGTFSKATYGMFL